MFLHALHLVYAHHCLIDGAAACLQDEENTSLPAYCPAMDMSTAEAALSVNDIWMVPFSERVAVQMHLNKVPSIALYNCLQRLTCCVSAFQFLALLR